LIQRLLWVPPAADVAQTEHARFIAALALVSMPALLLAACIVVPLWLNPADPTSTMAFRAGVMMFVATVGAFALNRRGRSELASRLVTLASVATLTYQSLESPLMLMYLPLSMLVAVALLPRRQAAAIGLAAVLSAVPVGFWFRNDEPLRVVLPFVLNAFFLPMMFVVKWHQDRLERLRAEQLAQREQWFATTLSSIGDAVLTTDRFQTVTFLNPAAEGLTGFQASQAVGRPVNEVFRVLGEATGDVVQSPVQQALERRANVGLGTHTLIARDGLHRPITDSGAPIVRADGTIQGVVLVFRDMSTERALRAQLEHSQRLDALGKLAGGVAHDFNNLLTAIVGGAQLAHDKLPSGHVARNYLSGVLDATERAVGVTRQLLAFSRRQVMRLEPVDLNAAIQGALRLYQRLLRAGVVVESSLAADAGLILVDRVQFEQVLLNLAINASDAMPDGGTITLSSRFVNAADAHTDPALPPGDYGLLRVTDTGIGMDERTMGRIFEPFFTTKERERGTGLGLATVYGIVEQSRGAIRVRSQPGVGSTFDVYLPATRQVLIAASSSAAPLSASVHGALAVMLVDDDDLVRRMAARVIAEAGYRVFEASSVQTALELLERATVDLLITDVVMPGLSGIDLAAQVRKRLPDLPILFTSGYASELLAEQGLRDAASSFVAKPFTPEALRAAVRASLAPESGLKSAE
jgi:two-component system, cell cycle sensor histidine kinase and response regulator CckA